MTLQNLQNGGPPYNYKNGVCLQTGGNRYWTANQCFALALGLQADPTPCEQFEFEFPNKTTALIDPLFFYNQGADTLNYYYNFDNQTLMNEFGDKILEDTCSCGWDYNPVYARFTEFCLTFWNQCLLDCKRQKYDGRTDSYFKDPSITFGQGQCKDPCASNNGVWPCLDNENCYPIKNEARCFKTFDKQYECMTKNCPDWDSEEPAINPVCVKIYAGVRIDNVYRGGGSVSAYTYRDTCMAQCEGFKPGDWETGSCSDIAVSSCEKQCEGNSGAPVCAEVQVQVQSTNSSNLFNNEEDGQISVSFETQYQTIPNECMAECLGWETFKAGECIGATVNVDKWLGFNSATCADYAITAGEPGKEGEAYREFCDDQCSGTGCKDLDDPLMTGCQACTECKDSPRCPKPPATGFASMSGNQWIGCEKYDINDPASFYKFCKNDVHKGTDPAFFGKRACEACPQCSGNPLCEAAWEGPDGLVCSNYALPALKKNCHLDYHEGTDPAYKGQRACEACPECKDGIPNPVCVAPSNGFVGGNIGASCSYYAGGNQQYCQDKHTGLDPSFKGKSACDVCNECSGATPCSVSTTGFVGYDYSTCSDYSEGGKNRNFCLKDKHQGLDQNYFGKTACESCPECSNFWGCMMPSTGFFGHKGASCAEYGASLNEFCFTDFAQGPDQNFKNKNACASCSECSTSLPCNAATGFRGFQRKYQCADYAGENSKFCRDPHTGDDTAFIGMDACQACGECANSKVCQDLFVSTTGFCEDYASQQKYCTDKYTGYGPDGPQTFAGQEACQACPNECGSSPVCQNAFYSNGLTCADYADAGNYEYCQYDEHSHRGQAAAGFIGKTACVCNECTGAPGC